MFQQGTEAEFKSLLLGLSSVANLILTRFLSPLEVLFVVVVVVIMLLFILFHFISHIVRLLLHD